MLVECQSHQSNFVIITRTINLFCKGDRLVVVFGINIIAAGKQDAINQIKQSFLLFGIFRDRQKNRRPASFSHDIYVGMRLPVNIRRIWTIFVMDSTGGDSDKRLHILSILPAKFRKPLVLLLLYAYRT